MSHSHRASGFAHKHPRENVLGVGVNAVNLQQAVATIDGWISQKVESYACVAAAHSIMDSYRDESVRTAFNAAGMVLPDGMSLVWLLRLLGHAQVDRVYGPDLLLSVCRQGADKDYGHFFYGGTPGALEQLSIRLNSRIPRLRITGSYSPPFRPLSLAEESQITQRIRAAKPDILWVGIGSPKQEIWMADHLNRLEVPVMIGVGAAFDFISGITPQAPRWMQRSGLEWLFRLTSEPKRLWRRYSLYPWFVALLLSQIVGLKSFELED